MSKREWLINIEIIADFINQELGSSAVVESVLAYYGAKNISGLSPSNYPDVFSDLLQIEADIA